MIANKLFISLLILVIALTGCSSAPGNDDSSSTGKVLRAWFDAPLPGTVFFPPNPCMIVAHGSSPNGIGVFELTINGTAVSVPSPDTETSLVTLTRDCALTQPGEYLLLLRAQDNNGNWSGYAETSLVIGERDAPPPAAQPIATVTFDPTLTPVIGPPDQLAITEVSTWVVYVGESSCGPMETVITARATASKGITAVILFYRFGSGDFQSISMNPIGNDLYRGTLSMASIFGSSIPFDQAIPEYQVVVQQSDGDTSLRTPVLADIAVQACGSSGGETDACSAFTDQRTCVAKDCNWWEIAGTPSTFVCKSKP